MAIIAQEDTFVTDADGIRRKVAKGSTVPAHLAAGFQEEVKTKTVPNAEAHAPVVSREEGDNVPHPVTQAKIDAAVKAEKAEKPAAARSTPKGD